MPSEHQKDVCLFAAEKTKRCNSMFEAKDRFRSETEKRFNEIRLSNSTYSSSMPHALLRSGGVQIDMKKFKNTYADAIGYFQVIRKSCVA